MVNKNRLLRLTQQLIRIKSENPPGDETQIAGFVKDYLKQLGLEVRIYEFKSGRPNVLAVLKGSNPRRSLLITPHLDTVPAGRNWKVAPFSARIIGGRLYGLGATDCKGNLACALEAIHSLVENKTALGYDLIFCATADEESGSELGLIPLLEKKILKPDLAVILDSDDFNIIVTQKGLMHLKVKIQGRRAHGAYPWRGTNAIDIAVNIISELKKVKFSYRSDKHLRPPTVNVGTIKGGDKVNIVADWCEFELDFRFLPGTLAPELLKKLRSIIKKYTKKFKIEIESIQQPYRISQKHELVLQLKSAMRNLKVKPLIKGSEGATVITFFQHKNIPALATGFGSGGCAHMSDEFVRVSNLYKGTQVLEEFLKSYKF